MVLGDQNLFLGYANPVFAQDPGAGAGQYNMNVIAGQPGPYPPQQQGQFLQQTGQFPSQQLGQFPPQHQGQSPPQQQQGQYPLPQQSIQATTSQETLQKSRPTVLYC